MDRNNALVTTADEKDAVDPAIDTYLRASRIVDAINSNLPQGARQLEHIPADYVLRRRDKEVVSTAIHAAFELCGGVPALAAWAQGNPTQFYNIWAKLLPSNTETPVAATTINFVTPIPMNDLDRVTIDENTGAVIDIDEIPE